MADVAICSLVRDGMEYLPSYRRQLESLSLQGGHAWELYILEGDSRDDSHAFLERWASDDRRVHVGREHAGDSAESEDRAARWARVCNACLDLVPSGKHSHLLWLESDLCFPRELLVRLLAHEVDVVAPVVWLGGLFYDTWGFRGTDGRRWSNLPPYHRHYVPMRLVEVNSVGSCVLFRGLFEAGIRFRPSYEDGLLVGMCNDARERGMRVWADTGTAILHPVDHWEAQMWRCEGVEIVDGEGASSHLDAAEAGALGMNANLTMLDPHTLLRTQRFLWINLFGRLGTNRLEVDAQARTYPRRSYGLRVRRLAPSGLAALEPIRRQLLKRVKLLPRLDGEPRRRGLARRLRPDLFRCSIRISMEPAP